MVKLLITFLVFTGLCLAQDPTLAVNFVFAQNSSLSTSRDLRAGCIPAALIIPAGWTAANITFRVSNDDGVTWGNLRDEFKTEIVVGVEAAGDVIRLNPADWYWLRNRTLQLRSGTSSAAVNQLNSSKTVTLLCGR